MATGSRPTTPLRRFSESRVAEAFSGAQYELSSKNTPLDSVLGEAFVELNDGFAQLESNLQHLQQVHESVTCFNESFASFLYGIQMNAWCVEFPEAPSHDSFVRYQNTLERLTREKELREQKEREERERQREIELQRQREREQERQREFELQQQLREQELQKQRQRQKLNPPSDTSRRSLKRPTDYTPGRPTYGRPPLTKLKHSGDSSSRIPGKPTWK